ncbi:MAG: LacI family DNA-binding transcriptional regulator [Victivallaceae bacterium]|nr:LacI family DNA-binding transcriptional regulator [Victivallaceae bacterium]
MEKKTTIKNIKELARLAGASVGSTSMVMSGKWEKKVKKETAARILEIANEYNYRVNPLGRSLQLKQYLRIAVVIEGTLQQHPLLGALSFYDFLDIVADRLDKSGYSIDIIQMTKEKISRTIRNGFFSANNDAVIFIDWNSGSLEKFLKRVCPEQPFIIIGDDLQTLQWNYLYRAIEKMSYKAVNHFIKNGHSKIAISRVCGSRDRFEKKLAGYKRALYEAGIKFNQDFVIDLNRKAHSLSYGVQIAKMFMELPEMPTAYFCDDNIDAMGLLIEFEKKTVKVPEKVEIIGYGDATVADMATKPLSYLKIPTIQMAEFAIEYILDILQNGKKTVPAQKQFEEELILQATTK